MVEEEWFKLVIDEIRTTNTKIDDLRRDVDEKVEHLNKTMGKIFSRAAEMDVRIKQNSEDVDEIEHSLQGNGAPGLKTKIQLLEKDLEILKNKADERNKMSVEKKRSSTAIQVALIGGAISGTIALIKVIIDLL